MRLARCTAKRSIIKESPRHVVGHWKLVINFSDPLSFLRYKPAKSNHFETLSYLIQIFPFSQKVPIFQIFWTIGDEKDNRIICRVCHRDYKSTRNLLQHLRRDNTGCARPNFISFMQKNPGAPMSLMLRVLSEESDYPDYDQFHVRCPNCDLTYKFKKDLYRHLRLGCDELTTEATVASRDGQSSQLPVFRCNLCSYVTFVKSFIPKHVQSAHSK